MKIRLTNIGLLCVAGPDAKSFLQGQLTCNMNDVTPRYSQLGAYVNIQGRIIATFRCFYWQDCYWLRLPKNSIPLTLTVLKKYAVFSKVSITDLSNEYGVIGFLETDEAPEFYQNYRRLPEVAGETVTSTEMAVIALPHLENHRRLEIIAEVNILDHIDAGIPSSSASPDAWDLLDIRLGVPSIVAANQEQLLPHHINYHLIGGIHFDKGCYLGQEIIARMQFRGKIKQHGYHFAIKSPIPVAVGMKLYHINSDQLLAEVVMASSAAQIYEVFLTMKDDDKDITEAMLHNEKVSLQRLPLPYEIITQK